MMCDQCTPIIENITAEYGEEFKDYLGGLSETVHLVCAHLVTDPSGPEGLSGWVSLAILVGLNVGRKHPEFAKKLVDGTRYGQQTIGNLDSARSAEKLEGVLLSGLKHFGWEEAHD